MNKQRIEEQINLILSGVSKEETFDSPKYDLDILLEDMGFVSKDDMDMNGWQGDFWETWFKDDVVLKISGSMYYGTCNVRLKGEEDE